MPTTNRHHAPFHWGRILLPLTLLPLLFACGGSSDNDNDFFIPVPSPTPEEPQTVRFASFNASLNRSNEGELIMDLSTPDNQQAKNIAEIIQRVEPDVLLINEFDYDAQAEALRLFQSNYLAVSQNGQAPIFYDFALAFPSNTGVLSGVDFNGDGTVSLPADAFGFGFFPGQFAFVILSKLPIRQDQIRTFQTFLWQDMPGAKLPDNPDTPEAGDFYSPEALAVFRLSSKNHVDVPIELEDGVVHVLAAHPTPPVFDGPEDSNGLRNFDEIRLFSDYVTPGAGDYLVDDNGIAGGLAEGEHFVVMGDMNADPFDGDSTDMAVLQLLDNPRMNPDVTFGDFVPASAGGVEFAEQNPDNMQSGDPAHDTANFVDGLRVDYVLPSKDLIVVGSGVFWPTTDSELFRLVESNEASSDHRLVWVDVRLP